MVRSAMSRENRIEGLAVTKEEFSTVEEIVCWYVVYNPKNARVINKTFVLKRAPNDRRERGSYKARLVFCETGE